MFQMEDLEIAQKPKDSLKLPMNCLQSLWQAAVSKGTVIISVNW